MEQAGGFECIAYCEIDKYAAAAYRAIYDTEKEVYYDDIEEKDYNYLGEDMTLGEFANSAPTMEQSM